jgi:transcriptional repressor NrdR
MRCPGCGLAESKVVDSRTARDGAAIRRRRECLGCGRRFTTYERSEEELPAVVKKDGRREGFDRNKVIGGMRRACEKRPIPLADLERIADRLERFLVDGGDREVESRRIGEWVMERLRELDGIAYVRFASVYREFKDVDDFFDALRQMLERGTSARLLDRGAPGGFPPGGAGDGGLR